MYVCSSVCLCLCLYVCLCLCLCLATRQTHGWAETFSHDAFSPQAGTQISNGSKEGISGQMCGTLAVWCWTTRRSADPSRVLVALDLKAAFQNVSRRAMLYSIEQNDADLAAVFSKWCTGTTEHRMHYDSAYTKISANTGVDQGCPLSTCGFSAAIDPVLRSVLAEICTQYDSGAIFLPTWTTGTF